MYMHNNQYDQHSIINYLIENYKRAPHAAAFVLLQNGEDIERTISNQELWLAVTKLAGELATEQLWGRKAVLVYQDMGQFIISFLACQYAGIIPIPVSYVKGKKQVARLFAIMEDAQPDAIFCCSYSMGLLQQGLSGWPGAEDIQIKATDIKTVAAAAPAREPEFNTIALIQYTSGSTGNPKGVVITNGNLLHNQQLIQNAFGCDQRSVIFSWLPFHHDMGLIGNILHSIYAGCTCVLMSPFHFMQKPLRWLRAISRFNVTHSGGPDFAYALCVEKATEEELNKLDLSSWRVAYNGSEPVRASTIKRFADHFSGAGFNEHAFFPCYGLAEATLLVAGSKKHPAPVTITVEKDPEAYTLVGCGGIMEGVEVKILSGNGEHACGEKETGEICISGNSITSGYWNKDNRELFYEWAGKPFLRTGDLGFMCNGELFVHGRIKEMLIVRGKNVYPYDIEQYITESVPAIERNAVALFSVDEAAGRLVVVAELKRNAGSSIDPVAIIHTIDGIVTGAAGVSPFDIILTTASGIPRTTSGKLQRVKCKEYYRQHLFTIVASKQSLTQQAVTREKDPRLLQAVMRTGDRDAIMNYLVNIMEVKVATLQRNTLHGDTVLADVGLDSLRTMELINVVNEELNINIDVSSVFQHNSLSALTTVIENVLWLKYAQPAGKEIII